MSIHPMVEADLDELSEMLGAAFAYPPAETPAWLDQGGRDNVRVVREGARAVACLLEVPMGHFFGGRSVQTCGVAGVAVALDKRRQGLARAMMRDLVLEIASRRCALSTLYPATQTLYRRAGYELAGKLVTTRVPLDTLRASQLPDGRGVEIRALGTDDAALVESAYAAVARDKHGWLDRGPYIWSRVRTPRSKAARGFGFFGGGGALEGHVYMAQERTVPSDPWHDVRLLDCIAKTPAALGAIIRFLYDQRSTARHVILRSGPSDPFLSVLDEPTWTETGDHDWMVRVCHLEAALEERGYPAHARVAIELELSDDLVADNRGRFTLDVAEGRGRVTRGGAGRAKLDVLALAPLFTGYLSAATLRRLGRIDADDATVAALDSVFISPMPSMGEMF
jgi:predicted acetyltransferase